MSSKTAFGVILVAFGVVQVIGSVTGNMAGMLAALFDPTDLVGAGGGSGKPAPKRSSALQGLLNTLAKNANLQRFGL